MLKRTADSLPKEAGSLPGSIMNDRHRFENSKCKGFSEIEIDLVLGVGFISDGQVLSQNQLQISAARQLQLRCDMAIRVREKIS